MSEVIDLQHSVAAVLLMMPEVDGLMSIALQRATRRCWI